MSEASSNYGGGVSFPGLLTVLFIGLKLTNYIDWSWWWVLSPLWISGIVGVLIIAGMLALAWNEGRR